jgi:hypothetical protein
VAVPSQIDPQAEADASASVATQPLAQDESNVRVGTDPISEEPEVTLPEIPRENAALTAVGPSTLHAAAIVADDQAAAAALHDAELRSLEAVGPSPLKMDTPVSSQSMQEAQMQLAPHDAGQEAQFNECSQAAQQPPHPPLAHARTGEESASLIHWMSARIF